MQTERAWKSAERLGLPVIFAVSLLDRDRGDFDKQVAALQELFDRRAELLFGDVGGEGDSRREAELHLGGRWVKATPAFNRELCDKVGIAPLEFDGERDSLFQPLDLEGRRHMEYVRDRGVFADLPLEQIRWPGDPTVQVVEVRLRQGAGP